jgi:hypothetical protein
MELFVKSLSTRDTNFYFVKVTISRSFFGMSLKHVYM